MKCTLLLLLLLHCMGNALYAQLPLESVRGLPTREIHDLHVDKKGYLWVAHGLGISRYDGLNFIHYSSKIQAALPVTDIIEDSQGRIWYHNYSGQLFYIMQGRIRLLSQYKFRNENQYPQMALCGSDLLVTSQNGLFVLSTTTLKSRYELLQKVKATGLVSLAIIGSKAVIFNHSSWYLYQQGRVRKLAADPAIRLLSNNMVSLQAVTYKDTLFLATNPAGTLQKLVLRHDSLIWISEKKYGDFINAITINRGKVWVHTRNKSTTMDGSATLNNYNITDVVTGPEGNTWYSSMKEGLLVSYQPAQWRRIQFPLDNHDYVRSLNVDDGYFFAGTQQGNLVVMKLDSSHPLWKYNLFNGYGSIDFIRFFKDHQFLIGTSTNTYIVNPLQHTIGPPLPQKSILDVDVDSTSLYLATANGSYAVPQPSAPLTRIGAKNSSINNEDEPPAPLGDTYLISPVRSRAIRYDSLWHTLFVATKNGLQAVTKNGMQPFTIGGKEVNASSLWYKQPQLYIATLNDGLWIRDCNQLLHFTTANYLFSNTILHIKLAGSHLWLFEDNGVQVLDTKRNRVIQYIDLPNLVGADVFDVAEKEGYAYLTTAAGIYKVPLQQQTKKSPPNGYLDYVIVNNKDTLFKENAKLPYNSNDVQFFFSSPAYYNPEAISFKYRLTGADEEWQVTKPSERMLRFSSLMPGNYVFEAVAVNKNGIQQPVPIYFSFEIQKPWWRTVWAILLLNGLIVAAIYLVLRNRARQKLRVEQVRQGIASDLHDDLGATLSSINIYAEMAAEEVGPNEYLLQVQQLVTNAVTRLDDLVWSINPKNDTMEQLLNRMRHTAGPLLEAAGIQWYLNYDRKLLDLGWSLEGKRQLYLLFKEMVNNVVKHARCQHCHINIAYTKPYIVLSVSDDGVGFDPDKAAGSRNGLQNMKYRAAKLKGIVQIHSVTNKGSEVTAHLKAL